MTQPAWSPSLVAGQLLRQWADDVSGWSLERQLAYAQACAMLSIAEDVAFIREIMEPDDGSGLAPDVDPWDAAEQKIATSQRGRRPRNPPMQVPRGGRRG